MEGILKYTLKFPLPFFQYVKERAVAQWQSIYCVVLHLLSTLLQDAQQKLVQQLTHLCPTVTGTAQPLMRGVHLVWIELKNS